MIRIFIRAFPTSKTRPQTYTCLPNYKANGRLIRNGIYYYRYIMGIRLRFLIEQINFRVVRVSKKKKKKSTRSYIHTYLGVYRKKKTPGRALVVIYLRGFFFFCFFQPVPIPGFRYAVSAVAHHKYNNMHRDAVRNANFHGSVVCQSFSVHRAV